MKNILALIGLILAVLCVMFGGYLLSVCIYINRPDLGFWAVMAIVIGVIAAFDAAHMLDQSIHE